MELINDFIASVYPDLSPAIFRAHKVMMIEEVSEERCLVKYVSGREFEIMMGEVNLSTLIREKKLEWRRKS